MGRAIAEMGRLYHGRRMLAAAAFDDALASPALYADPYPVFRQMRRRLRTAVDRLRPRGIRWRVDADEGLALTMA